ncbi:MAG: TolC family protein [Armatimonadota bacterium]|nr:TolC family protein [Armatimonadota bacterium]
MQRRRRGTRRAATLGLALALPLTLTALPRTWAQTPAPPAPPTAPATTAPAGRSVTLDEVVATALRNNTSVILAQERLRKAQEQIAQVDAQARPQVRIDVTDTLSSNRTFAASGGSIQNPTLPGGGQIPIIVDQGGGNSSGFVGGGGGGTTSSNGQTGTGSGSSTSTSGTGTSGLGTSSGGLGTGTGIGGNSGAGTTGTGLGTGIGTGTTGTNSGTTGVVGAHLIALAQMPTIVNDYAAQTQADSRLAPYTIRQTPADTTGIGGTGTGTVVTTTNGSRGNYNNYSGRLSVTQYLDIFNLVGAARDVQNITRDFYQFDLQRVANETALSAKSTFFNVLRYQDQVAVQQEQVNFATENLRIAQARFNAGAAAQFDVVTAQTSLANAQNQLIQAQNTVALTEENLNNLLAVPQDEPLTLQTPPLPAPQTPAPAQVLQTAYANRPELRQADNNIVIAQRLIKLSGASLKPTLGLVGSAGYGGPSTVTSDGKHETFSLSAVLGIPLSDGGTTRSRERSARIDLETQTVTRSQLRSNVELEVRQALSNLSTAQARITATTQGVAQGREAVRLAQVRYQNGIGTLLDVTNAQANLAVSRTNLSGAQYDYQTALAQLTRAEGGR